MWRRAGLICLAASLVAACADTPSRSPQEQLLRQYVALLATGDTQAAVDMRCAAAAVAPDKVALLAQEVDKIRESTGGALGVSKVTEVKPVTLGSLYGKAGDHELEFQLHVDGGSSSALRVAIVSEGGGLKLCGWSIAESDVLLDQLVSAPLNAIDRHIDDLQGVATEAAQALRVEPTASEQVTVDGIDGWTVAWARPPFGGGRITMIRYGSAAQALVAARQRVVATAPDAFEIFTSPAFPGGVGDRNGGSLWTGVQPARLGWQIDNLVAVFDDVVIRITITGLEPDDDHSRLEAVATALAASLPPNSQ